MTAQFQKRDLESRRLKLAATSRYCLRMAGDVLDSDTLHKTQILGNEGMSLKPHP